MIENPTKAQHVFHRFHVALTQNTRGVYAGMSPTSHM